MTPDPSLKLEGYGVDPGNFTVISVNGSCETLGKLVHGHSHLSAARASAAGVTAVVPQAGATSDSILWASVALNAPQLKRTENIVDVAADLAEVFARVSDAGVDTLFASGKAVTPRLYCHRSKLDALTAVLEKAGCARTCFDQAKGARKSSDVKVEDVGSDAAGGVDDLDKSRRRSANKREDGGLAKGSKVKYWSQSIQRWVTAVVLRCNDDGSVDLDCKRGAKAKLIKLLCPKTPGHETMKSESSSSSAPGSGKAAPAKKARNTGGRKRSSSSPASLASTSSSPAAKRRRNKSKNSDSSDVVPKKKRRKKETQKQKEREKSKQKAKDKDKQPTSGGSSQSSSSSSPRRGKKLKEKARRKKIAKETDDSSSSAVIAKRKNAKKKDKKELRGRRHKAPESSSSSEAVSK